jgi:hypothetical protein
MIEIDLPFFYSLAWRLREAINGLQVTPPSNVALHYAKDALLVFVASPTESVLVSSKSKARQLILTLDSMTLSPTNVTPTSAMELYVMTTQFEEELREECKHLYIHCVEDQRILSAYTLIEKIESAISEKTWKYMSEPARAEIEESGKCLALERHTASGFHILRSVESVIREYLTALNIPLSASDRNWGAYVRILKDHGAAEEVISIVDNLRRDDRNPLMHPERFLSMDQSIGLFFLCLTALDRLIGDLCQRGVATEYKPPTTNSAVQEHPDQRE